MSAWQMTYPRDGDTDSNTNLASALFKNQVNTTSCKPDDFLPLARERYHPHKALNPVRYSWSLDLTLLMYLADMDTYIRYSFAMSS